MKTIFCALGLIVVTAAVGGYFAITNYGEPGSGISLTEQRELPTFNRISMAEFGTLNVTRGESQTVAVTTDDNLVPFIETRVEDGELKIQPVRAVDPKVELVIDVTVPELASLELAGAVSADLNDLQGDSFSLEMAGACGVDASGAVDLLSVEMAGACRGRLKSLKARKATVEIAGAGSLDVYASEEFSAEAAGVASITCYGNPKEVHRESAGVSSIKIVKP